MTMTGHDRADVVRSYRGVGMVVAALATLTGLAATGCSRDLMITQDDYVNTATHIIAGRPPEAQTGLPLEVNIVCVYESDLDEGNERLRPDSNINSQIWFTNRPVPGDTEDKTEGHDRLWLPRDQILLFTNDREYHGKRLGPALRGAKEDGKEIKKSFDYSVFALHDNNAVIYVFAKFTDDKGKVLEVPSATFHPPGAYKRDLLVHIGVDPKRPHYGQYIENRTERKMHDGSKEE